MRRAVAAIDLRAFMMSGSAIPSEPWPSSDFDHATRSGADRGQHRFAERCGRFTQRQRDQLGRNSVEQHDPRLATKRKVVEGEQSRADSVEVRRAHRLKVEQHLVELVLFQFVEQARDPYLAGRRVLGRVLDKHATAQLVFHDADGGRRNARNRYHRLMISLRTGFATVSRTLAAAAGSRWDRTTAAV